MTRRSRRTIFYLLVLVFALAAPLTILYATGYSYDWENKRLLKTGAFYFRTIPKKTEVSINGIKSDTAPGLIERLLPGEYEIEISKEGYQPWKKKLEINSQLVTEARDVFLVPEKPKINLTSLETTTSSLLIFLSFEQRNAFDLASTTMSKLPGVSAWTNSGDKIYYLQNSSIAYQADLDGRNKKQISLEPLPETKAGWRLIAKNSRLAALAPDVGLFLLGREEIFEIISNKTQGAQFSPDAKKMLYWSDHEVWAMWLEENLIQPPRKAGDKELITRLAKKIKQAAWFEETGEHIFLAVEGDNGNSDIKLIELDRRDYRNIYDIFSAPSSEIFYSDKDKLLYIQNDLKLYSLDIF
ncbi:MAG: PEGA domain-containing protein [Candidatus Portnoybacteria bacterium]|nr:PEGA domain-containing protein [Candidatus Portnoybacteria bacterium]